MTVCAIDGCGGECAERKNKFCSVACSNRARTWHAPEAELRFHFYRLGSREDVAKLYGVHHKCVFRQLPMRDIDSLRRGEMVNIGGILAKRCRVCHVTRQLNDFKAAVNKSGCGSQCKYCRLTAASLARRDT